MSTLYTIARKALRYFSVCSVAYFSYLGVKSAQSANIDQNFIADVAVGIIFSSLPTIVLFFGVGASEVDFPDKVREGE